MNILEFADVIGKDIEIIYFSNQDGRFMAHFKHCETSDGCLLRGDHGNGKEAKLALNDYSSQISGEKIVFGAFSDNRIEYSVPSLDEL